MPGKSRVITSNITLNISEHLTKESRPTEPSSAKLIKLRESFLKFSVPSPRPRKEKKLLLRLVTAIVYVEHYMFDEMHLLIYGVMQCVCRLLLLQEMLKRIKTNMHPTIFYHWMRLGLRSPSFSLKRYTILLITGLDITYKPHCCLVIIYIIR